MCCLSRFCVSFYMPCVVFLHGVLCSMSCAVLFGFCVTFCISCVVFCILCCGLSSCCVLHRFAPITGYTTAMYQRHSQSLDLAQFFLISTGKSETSPKNLPTSSQKMSQTQCGPNGDFLLVPTVFGLSFIRKQTT